MGAAPINDPCRTGGRATLPVPDEWWIMLDGRPFFVAGYTSGGTPYGTFADEIPPYDDPL
ncbi:hypothetical protein GCM10027610_081010 [Dactylosporangium cerinum]